MKKNDTRQAQISKYFIAIYQIIGGLIGVGIVYTESSSNSSLVLMLIQYAFFVLSIVAGGVLLILGKGMLTYINLFLQFIQFKIGGYALYFLQGIYLGVGFFPSKMEFFTDFSYSLFVVLFRVNHEAGKDIIGLNLFVLLLLFLMNRYENLTETKRT